MAEGCAGCHGAEGVSQTALTPSLAGEPDEFVQWQLRLFSLRCPKERRDAVHRGSAQQRRYSQSRRLLRFAGAAEPAASADALAQSGEKLAAQHRCKSCHSDDYTGFRAAARLAGQREDVLLKALREFKTGARVGSGVASMADVTYELSDADMQALAHYFAMRP